MQLGDTFYIRFVELHRNTERNGRHDRGLVRRIDAFDVKGRVGFGVTELLRFLQRRVEIDALVAHFGQDEIGGAVDDAGDPFNAVGGQPFAQCLDDRNAAGNRGFKRNHHAFILRGLENLGAVRGQQGLVGGDDVLAVGNRLHHQILGDTVPADQFDDDVDIGMRDHQIGVVDHHALTMGQLGCTRGIQVGHHRNFNTATGASHDFFLVALENVECAGADCADAKQTYFDGFHDESLYKIKIPP